MSKKHKMKLMEQFKTRKQEKLDSWYEEENVELVEESNQVDDFMDEEVVELQVADETNLNNYEVELTVDETVETENNEEVEEVVELQVADETDSNDYQVELTVEETVEAENNEKVEEVVELQVADETDLNNYEVEVTLDETVETENNEEVETTVELELSQETYVNDCEVELTAVEELKEETTVEVEVATTEAVESVIKEMKNHETTENKEINKKRELLYEYAYCGGVEFFNNQIHQLASIAEKEIWSNKGNGTKNILKSYIIKTFERCYNLGIISKSNDGMWTCFNTGLMTVNGQDIVGLFTKNAKANEQEWYFTGFKTESDKEFLDHFDEIPCVATYVNDESDYTFDSNKEMIIDVNHVLDENFDKYPTEVKKLGKEVLKLVLMSAFETSKKKVKRNSGLVVPQFHNEKVSYLLPITIPVADNKNVTMALVAEKGALGNYNVNTMFTKEMAYTKARLIMKPESNWLA